MTRNRNIPELLEEYMEQSGGTEQWITVQEFRAFFHLDEMDAPAISGFFRRIHQGPFFTCHYRVERMERIVIQSPQSRYIKRYLVKRRSERRRKRDGADHQD